MVFSVKPREVEISKDPQPYLADMSKDDMMESRLGNARHNGKVEYRSHQSGRFRWRISRFRIAFSKSWHGLAQCCQIEDAL